MNRRTVLRNAIILSAGAAVLPSCWQSDQPLIVLKNLSFSREQETMLAQLSDTILPKASLKWAAGIQPHEFMLMMVDDCYAPDVQKTFTDGMKQFDKLVENKYGKSFAKCTPAQKAEWLTAIEARTNIPDEVQRFYSITKRHTMQAFTSSKEYMTDVLKFKLVPGSNFKGCVPVKKA